MKILAFEWLVGGGIAGQAAVPADNPFLVQGAGMYGTILDDCLSIGAEVLSPLDPRFTQTIDNFETLRVHVNFHGAPINTARDLEPALKSLAQQADHIFLIAPECDGILTRCLQWLDGFQSKLVCGPQSLIETFADKNATQQLLESHRIPVPNGAELSLELLDRLEHKAIEDYVLKNGSLSWPMIIKPSSGAGGDNVFLCHNRDQLQSAIAMLKETDDPIRVERYITGTPASVSIVRNRRETRLLAATEQRFSNACSQRQPNDFENVTPEPIGHFVKSVYPLPEHLQRRAAALAKTVADVVPTWRGYLGVDMVLANDGPDVVVELNPRLTASYTKIRAETGFNLMEFLLGGQ